MLDYFTTIFREYPPLALFLTVGLGFLIGKLKIGNFTLGSVTAVLLVGVIVGQLEIPMSGPLKQVFFMLFLFSIGYSVGPDFFKSLKGSGTKQALFAVAMSSLCCGITLLLSWLFDYSKGETVGLFSGSQTCSALLGVGSEAITRLGLPKDVTDRELNIIPVCYAVTYIFGTLGTVVIIGNIGPRLLGGIEKVRKQTALLEKELNNTGRNSDPAYINAMRHVEYRSYIVSDDYFKIPRRVYEIEKHLRQFGLEVYIDKLRTGGDVVVPAYSDFIKMGEEIVICGRSEYIVDVERYVGKEISDPSILSYPLARVPVRVVRKSFIGKPLTKLRQKLFMHGVVVRDATRGGQLLEITGDTVFQKGDVVTIMGRPVQVNIASLKIGHADRPSISSDLMFVGLAIFIGGLFGALSFYIGSIPISFGTSGGSLVAGLVFGWLRSKRPTFGNISPGALWLMNNLGLNVFIAVVGIEAAPSFVSGIKTVGPMLFVAGAVGTSIPLLFGLWFGHKVMRFNPAITLGCCAGTRTCTAALGAVQNTIGSTLPAMGYTVTYAVSNILLVVWGLITVLIC